jgi:hypothetical protein
MGLGAALLACGAKSSPPTAKVAPEGDGMCSCYGSYDPPSLTASVADELQATTKLELDGKPVESVHNLELEPGRHKLAAVVGEMQAAYELTAHDGCRWKLALAGDAATLAWTPSLECEDLMVATELVQVPPLPVWPKPALAEKVLAVSEPARVAYAEVAAGVRVIIAETIRQKDILYKLALEDIAARMDKALGQIATAQAALREAGDGDGARHQEDTLKALFDQLADLARRAQNPAAEDCMCPRWTKDATGPMSELKIVAVRPHLDWLRVMSAYYRVDGRKVLEVRPEDPCFGEPPVDPRALGAVTAGKHSLEVELNIADKCAPNSTGRYFTVRGKQDFDVPEHGFVTIHVEPVIGPDDAPVRMIFRVQDR